jgi:hypothetical protein
MARGLPHNVKANMEKCRSAAIAAVDVYNRPGSRFKTAHYIVLTLIRQKIHAAHASAASIRVNRR